MKLSILVAMSENRVIGRDQKLPWHLPEDLKRFKQLTMGHPIIMGRKTFDSIGRVLPGRTNIVVTRSPDFKVEGVTTASSIKEALKPYEKMGQEVFVIGGGEIFSQVLSQVDKIYLTLVHQHVDGNVFFPNIDWSLFVEISRESYTKPVKFSFIEYKKNN